MVMKNEVSITIEKLGRELDGVFTIRDLEVILNEKSGATFYRAIEKLVSTRKLIKVSRGIYVTKEATLFAISSRIYPQSYISTGAALAKKSIIGSVPARKIQAIKIGKPRKFQSVIGTIEYLSINPKLYFGFEKKGITNWASPEKALLDVFYYYYKGKRFSFDPFSDVNHEDLNFKVINRFLLKYDKRFVTYFKQNFLNRVGE